MISPVFSISEAWRLHPRIPVSTNLMSFSLYHGLGLSQRPRFSPNRGGTAATSQRTDSVFEEITTASGHMLHQKRKV